MDNGVTLDTYDTRKFEELKPYAEASMMQTGVPASMLMSVAYLGNKEPEEIVNIADKFSSDRVLQNLARLTNGADPMTASLKDWELSIQRAGAVSNPNFFDKLNNVINGNKLQSVDEEARNSANSLNAFIANMEKNGNTMAIESENAIAFEAPAIDVTFDTLQRVQPQQQFTQEMVDKAVASKEFQSASNIFDSIMQNSQHEGQSEDYSRGR